MSEEVAKALVKGECTTGSLLGELLGSRGRGGEASPGRQGGQLLLLLSGDGLGGSPGLGPAPGPHPVPPGTAALPSLRPPAGHSPASSLPVGEGAEPLPLASLLLLDPQLLPGRKGLCLPVVLLHFPYGRLFLIAGQRLIHKVGLGGGLLLLGNSPEQGFQGGVLSGDRLPGSGLGRGRPLEADTDNLLVRGVEAAWGGDFSDLGDALEEQVRVERIRMIYLEGNPLLLLLTSPQNQVL